MANFLQVHKVYKTYKSFLVTLGQMAFEGNYQIQKDGEISLTWDEEDGVFKLGDYCEPEEIQKIEEDLKARIKDLS